MPTETRKPLDTGLGSAMDEAVPLYPPEPLTAYTAACLPDRLRSAAHYGLGDPDVVSVLHEAADKLEAADALLSLSARYRDAHAAYKEALATSQAAFNKRPIVSAATWERLEGEFKAAESAMEAAKQALLSAARDIT